MVRLSLFLSLSVALVGCPPTTPTDPYAFDAPPADAAPASLEPSFWSDHLTGDLLPFWMMTEAQGSPIGNFPTWRGMDGSLQGSTNRKPRMLGRQTFTYAIGFMITGDEAYLDLARAGNRWLLDHARDTAVGGWHADLDSTGAPSGTAAKFAQDMAYDAMGPAAYYFVTRDPEAEAAVLATRDLLFDPQELWDATNGRIKDGMDATLTTETFMTAQGSWELVAQLDPITAFMLLTQPVLSDPARREQVLGDLATLADRMRASFWRDGLFWGTTGGIGVYGSRHADYGHTLKAYWAVLQIDKRLAAHPHQDFLAENAAATLTRAHDAGFDRWYSRPTSLTANRPGNDWWSYAEADQLAATLALHDPAWIDTVAKSSANFVGDFVDDTRPARELIPSIKQDGSWAYGWPVTDTAKCNEWKNGFHGAEHALVMYLFSHWRTNTPAPLYFALPAEQLQALAAATTPYTFGGDVSQVEDLGPLAGDSTRHKVRISFEHLR